MNHLDNLPRGFGAFPMLEVLDLTYNNLIETSFPANFFILGRSSSHLFKLGQNALGAAVFKLLNPILKLFQSTSI
jgi:hypothetical protein